MDKLSKQVIETSEEILRKTELVADKMDEVFVSTSRSIDKSIDPVRRSVLKRFPTLFLLIVTFGASTTFFAIDELFSNVNFFNDNPWLVLAIGIGTLVLTGKLYKKLE